MSSHPVTVGLNARKAAKEKADAAEVAKAPVMTHMHEHTTTTPGKAEPIQLGRTAPVSTGTRKTSNASLSKTISGQSSSEALMKGMEVEKLSKTISGQSSSEALMKGMEVEKEAVVLKLGEPKDGDPNFTGVRFGNGTKGGGVGVPGSKQVENKALDITATSKLGGVTMPREADTTGNETGDTIAQGSRNPGKGTAGRKKVVGTKLSKADHAMNKVLGMMQLLHFRPVSVLYLLLQC
jgi:hypothetical protein